jgi:hypothetical protein
MGMRIYSHDDLPFIITFLLDTMFSLSLILVLISQFTTANSQLFCLTCPRRTLYFGENNVIDSTGCVAQTTSSFMCQADLSIDQYLGQATVSSGGSNYQFNVQSGKKLTLGSINIFLEQNYTTRQLVMHSFSNQSGVSEINDTYIKGNSFHKMVAESIYYISIVKFDRY